LIGSVSVIGFAVQVFDNPLIYETLRTQLLADKVIVFKMIDDKFLCLSFDSTINLKTSLNIAGVFYPCGNLNRTSDHDSLISLSMIVTQVLGMIHLNIARVS